MLNLDGANFFYFMATGVTPAMAIKLIGKGSQYMWTARDSQGNVLDGGKNYKLHVPPNVPVKDFCSVWTVRSIRFTTRPGHKASIRSSPFGRSRSMRTIGWSIYSNATITANWTKEQSERWTVPVGGGVGKLSYAGKLPISMSLQSFYNAVTPTGGPHWSVNFQLALLFAAPQQ